MEIIVVNHFNSIEQSIKNIETCKSLGINKIFMIDHHCDNDSLIKNTIDFKSQYPDMWFGVNLLGIKTNLCIKKDEISSIDGLWSDETISSDDYSNRTFPGLYFGGLAFKYQPQPLNLEEACKHAVLTTDIATTSGAGTGIEANLSKIEKIRTFLGSHPMAIASGVNNKNIIEYKNLCVDYVLVASSIIEYINKEEIISSKKLEELVKGIQ